MLDYPAHTFLRFCDNHGLLHVLGKPQWLSIPGGARRYVEAASRSFSGEVFFAEPAERVERTASGVRVSTARRARDYDAVVLATHPPQTCELLGEGMTPAEREVLGAFTYRPNDVLVHTDESFMPRARRAWASWNWCSASSDSVDPALMLTYRINSLQQLPTGTPAVFETLNRDHEAAPGSVLAELSFDHPMFTRQVAAAQSRIPEIQGADRLWYAGAWIRYGFHEDGFLSAVRVAEGMGVSFS